MLLCAELMNPVNPVIIDKRPVLTMQKILRLIDFSHITKVGVLTTGSHTTTRRSREPGKMIKYPIKERRVTAPPSALYLA